MWEQGARLVASLCGFNSQPYAKAFWYCANTAAATNEELMLAVRLRNMFAAHRANKANGYAVQRQTIKFAQSAALKANTKKNYASQREGSLELYCHLYLFLTVCALRVCKASKRLKRKTLTISSMDSAKAQPLLTSSTRRMATKASAEEDKRLPP
jgi:hypothetical protein